MSARIAAVSAVAASLFATALPAASADLYEPRWNGHGGVYHDDGPIRYQHHERYTEWREDHDHPIPPRSVYGGKGFPRPHYDSYYHKDCVSRRVVRKRLRAHGWRGFRHFERNGDVVLVQARRRHSRRLFELTLDRCSGEIVDVCPLNRDRDFAYRRY